MKKLVIGSVALFFAALFAISYMKKGATISHHEAPKNRLEQDSLRAQTEQFWQVYRQATDARLAGKFQSAADFYSKALEIDPEHENSLYYLGNMRAELGDFNAAKRIWQDLIDINPSSSRAYVQLGNAYLNPDAHDHFDVQQAQICFEKAISINAEETGPLLRLGQIALVKRDFTSASKYFQAVLKSNFKSVPAYYLSGFIAWLNGDLETAKVQFSQAVKHAGGTKAKGKVLGEGDTRPGITIEIREPAFSKLLMQDQQTTLQHLQTALFDSEMNKRYQNLKSVLETVGKKTEKLPQN